MGYAIAEAALECGHDVVLISGPVCLEPPDGATMVRVNTSDEMFNAVRQNLQTCDLVVMAAVVADYKPANVSATKLKKRDAKVSLELVPTPDILASISQTARDFLVVGFAAETENVEQNAGKKLREKDLDLIIANDVSNPDFGIERDENELTILFRNGEMKKLSRAPKRKLAVELVKIFANSREKCLTKKMP